jgi:hypothetical protein
VAETALDLYADAFVEPGRFELDDRPAIQIAPGTRGVAAIRLLITDDSGYDRLVGELAGAWHGVVLVLDRASRCNDLLRGESGWGPAHSELAMVLPDIHEATVSALPAGLDLRSMSTDEAGSSKWLQEVVRLAIASDPGVPGSSDDVARFIGSLPPSCRLLVAFDEGGAARASAACHVFGRFAEIFFVNTEPAWRRRGIGQAMTLAALRTAAGMGATSGMLHATEDGVSVYKRLGFEPVGMLTRYERSD